MRSPLPRDGAAWMCTYGKYEPNACNKPAVTLVSDEDVESIREFSKYAMRALCEQHAALAEDRE